VYSKPVVFYFFGINQPRVGMWLVVLYLEYKMSSKAIIVHEICKRFGSSGTPLLARRMSRLGGKLQGYLAAYMEQQSGLALDHVSFSVESNEIFALCGPVGSGKSTLIQLLATLLLPDDGEIRVFDYDVVKQPSIVRRQINKVAVDVSLFKQTSAVENLLYRARLDGVGSDVNRDEAQALLERLGLESDVLNQPLEELGREQHQIVAIATRLQSASRLLLLDEPFIGLSMRLKSKVCNVIEDFRCTKGLTVLYTTCSKQDAHLLADCVAYITKGRIVNIEKVIYQPEQEFLPEIKPVVEKKCYELPVGI
jgi:ABC-2 type transport system ATP-binding protein